MKKRENPIQQLQVILNTVQDCLEAWRGVSFLKAKNE
jgi:hypothetical protein